MANSIQVVKRNGTRENLNLDKIHKMVAHACDGFSNVSASQVEMNSGIQFYDGIKTDDIQKILIRSASDLIELENPNYQFVAARLILFSLYHDVWGQLTPKPLSEMIEHNVNAGVYSDDILEKYTEDELERLESYINHQRDLKFTYAGIRQIVDKYLVQDRSNGTIFETPQQMYMMIAATIFADYPKETRLTYVRKYYDATSLFKINLPTPVMSGVRTPIKQYASCVLVDVDDSLDSIFSSDTAIGMYTAQRAGIGINAGRIRGLGSKVRSGEVEHTGVIPFLRKFQSTVRCCTQNGVRGGSATVHFPIWHQEIEDIMVLKNNGGSEDNRVRKLDYSIQISKLFYTRLLKDGYITLFSPSDVSGLNEAFGTPAFDELYEKYERNKSIPKRRVKAKDLFSLLMKERAEVGKIYIMNIDHANEHSSFKDKIWMSNLCQEITLPTQPITSIENGSGEIALCILSAINLAAIKQTDDFEELCDLAVRALDEIIDIQEYPLEAAKQSTQSRRSLGIGFINLAYYLAKAGLKYSDKEALDLMNKTTEALQYYLLKASNELAKEKGPCKGFDRTKYSDGILPIDTYKKKSVDKLISDKLQLPWEELRTSILEHGLRNSTLSAQMPSESSSVVSNATNGIEPVRAFLTIKKSKKGTLKQIVPEYQTLKNKYDLLWDMKDVAGYTQIMAVIQKYFDQSISTNLSYNPEHVEHEILDENKKKISEHILVADLLKAYSLGLKTIYYQNTYDDKKEMDDEDEAVEEKKTAEVINIDDRGCDSGACAI